jgi:hypothetical protein
LTQTLEKPYPLNILIVGSSYRFDFILFYGIFFETWMLIFCLGNLFYHGPINDFLNNQWQPYVHPGIAHIHEQVKQADNRCCGVIYISDGDLAPWCVSVGVTDTHWQSSSAVLNMSWVCDMMRQVK